MKSRFLLLLLLSLCFVIACPGSPTRTHWVADQNRSNLLKLNLGMTKEQVLSVMGEPHKTEMYEISGRPVEFWLYMTEGKNPSDPRITDANFTPLAFDNGRLKGWGRNFYDNELRIRVEQK